MVGFGTKRTNFWVGVMHVVLWTFVGCTPSTSAVVEVVDNHETTGREAELTAEKPIATSEQHSSIDYGAAGGVLAKSSKPFLLRELDRSRGVCLLIVGTDCPISNAYAPELARIVDDFEEAGVRFYLVYSARWLSTDDALHHALEYGLKGEVVLDASLEIAQALGATRMPEAVLLSATGEAIYQGRIDDRYPAPGAKRREHPTSFDLREALQAYTTGKPVQTSRTPAVGCPLDFAK